MDAPHTGAQKRTERYNSDRRAHTTRRRRRGTHLAALTSSLAATRSQLLVTQHPTVPVCAAVVWQLRRCCQACRMEPSAVNAEFRVHGLSLRSDAMRATCDFLAAQADAEHALAQLLATLQAASRAHPGRAARRAWRLPDAPAAPRSRIERCGCGGGAARACAAVVRRGGERGRGHGRAAALRRRLRRAARALRPRAPCVSQVCARRRRRVAAVHARAR